MTVHTSRRALFGGAGLIAVAALAKCGSNPAHAATASPRLLRVIALRDRAEAAWERYERDVEAPTQKAYAATVEAEPVETPPPHRETPTSFVNLNGEDVRLTTANPGNVATSRRFVSDPTWASMGDADWRQARLENAAAADERDGIIAAQKERRAAFEAKMEAAFGLQAIEQRATQLLEREYDLWRRVITMPATSMADITTKLAFVDRVGRTDTEGCLLAALTADVRRLAGEA